MLGKLAVPGHPANMHYSRARAYCASSGCGWELFWTFLLLSIISFLSLYLLEMVRYSWLVGCLGFNSPLRQYFSLYQAVSQREGETGEKG